MGTVTSPNPNMPPDPQTERRSKENIEQRSESSGSLLRPALIFVVGTVVGWVAYLYAALVVLNFLVRWDAIVTVIPGLSPSVNFWLSVGMLVVVAFALFARPGTVLAGWLAMGGIVAVAATYFVGWTQTIVIVEGLTLAFAAFAGFAKIISMLPPWAVVFLDLDRRKR